jgi:hypothetical protein
MKAAVFFSAAAIMAMMAVSVPTPAEARGGWGWGPGIAGGLLAGALNRRSCVKRLRIWSGLWLLRTRLWLLRWLCARILWIWIWPTILRTSLLSCISPGLLPSLLRSAFPPGGLGRLVGTNLPKSRSKMSAMARLRHADLVEQCPFAGCTGKHLLRPSSSQFDPFSDLGHFRCDAH